MQMTTSTSRFVYSTTVSGVDVRNKGIDDG